MDPDRIKKIYSGRVARHYDLPISHMFRKYKVKAFNSSSLKPGDRVLVFCCGTGLDFSHILKRIGDTGTITGIDFSEEMLDIARKRIQKRQWANVELIHGDVTRYENSTGHLFDAGVCTLGLSIIPDYIKAYENLVAAVKEGGEVIIGDMQLASNKFARFNPLTILLAKRYGGSETGHRNSLAIRDRMKQELRDRRNEEFFLGSYFYCLGRK
jgi:demethylmenaquinone methyltransferase/2-methoxy-6-polyprenyl-1,4-benzoquinol methylase